MFQRKKLFRLQDGFLWTFRIKAVNGTGSGNHALKFEQGTTGDTEVQFSITGTEWTDVSLDFVAGLGNYGRMVLFTDFGDAGGGLSDTYLFDDICSLLRHLSTRLNKKHQLAIIADTEACPPPPQ